MASDLRERVGARPPTGPPTIRGGGVRAVLRTLGVVFLVAGVLLVALLAWQLWGTGLSTQRAQTELRRQLNSELAAPVAGTGSGSVPRVTFVPIPARGQPIAELRIPRIALDMVVVEGTSATELATGPGHYVGTAYPWEDRGRVGIAGHRTTYLHPFWALDRLRPGDRISLETKYGTFVYAVTGSRTVLPQDVWVLKGTPEPSLVLTTCTPRFSASHRLVVFARRIEDVTPPAAAAATEASRAPGGRAASDHPDVLAGDAASNGTRTAAPLLAGAALAALVVGLAWVVRRRRVGERLHP